MKIILLPLLLFLSLGAGAQINSDNHVKIVQFDINPVLNARPVTTLNSGRLLTWKNGIDGGGKGDGYLTRSAAAYNRQDSTHALPDNALIPANDLHPKIQLHYSNRDSLNYQARSMPGEASVEFSVPKTKYTELYFALTSAEGASYLKMELEYTDGVETQEVLLPDYYADLPAGSTSLCYLAHNLAKWGPANQMTEKDHHNIDLLKISPDSKKILKEIRITKGKEGYLVLWAAAGKTR